MVSFKNILLAISVVALIGFTVKSASKEESFFIALPTFETERLVLRKIKLDDLKDVLPILSDPEVTRYFSLERIAAQYLATTKKDFSKKGLEETKQQVVKEYQKDQEMPWIFELKDGKKIVGFGGFEHYDKDKKESFVYYVLDKAHWGKGYASETVKAIINVGFNTLKLNKIYAKIDARNIASIKLITKFGFSEDTQQTDSSDKIFFKQAM